MNTESRVETAQLPAARGDLSELVLSALERPPYELAPALPVHGDPLAGDEDFHLALYCLYELHYRSFEGVDDRWEWDPSLLRLRAELERRFEGQLREALAGAQEPAGRDLPEQLKELLATADGPPLSRFLEMRASVDQFREVLVHKSAYQLKEADPHSFAIPRLSGRPKVALVEVQFDEYGGGRPERQHARLFAGTMEALGLDGSYGAYLDAIPGYTLAAVNLMSLFGLHRRLRGAVVGHLAALEMDSTQPNRRYGNGLRRLGGNAVATRFYDEHVEADAVHEQIAAHDLCGAFCLENPDQAPAVLFGAACGLALDRLFADHVLARWRADDSSLLGPPIYA